MKTRYIEYKPKRILNTHKHIDGAWFWSKYSANPYLGCEHACEYCYAREEKYNPYDTAKQFHQIIKVKMNAPELLEAELSKKPMNIIIPGHYQPVDTKYRLMRKMLEVCLKLNFPVLLIAKSPLLLKDLDLLQEINKKCWCGVMWSIISAKSGKWSDTFEPRTPKVESRFEAMRKLVDKGITTGTAAMPILPFILDSKENISELVKTTRDHGGKFVLYASLTLADKQKKHFYHYLDKGFSGLKTKYEELYGGKYDPGPIYNKRMAIIVKEECKKVGITDYMKRPLKFWPENKRLNKEIAAYLFRKVRELELQSAPSYKLWAYRKAAWAIDELEYDIKEVYEKMGIKGLINIKGVGESIGKEIEKKFSF